MGDTGSPAPQGGRGRGGQRRAAAAPPRPPPPAADEAEDGDDVELEDDDFTIFETYGSAAGFLGELDRRQLEADDAKQLLKGEAPADSERCAPQPGPRAPS